MKNNIPTTITIFIIWTLICIMMYNDGIVLQDVKLLMLSYKLMFVNLLFLYIMCVPVNIILEKVNNEAESKNKVNNEAESKNNEEEDEIMAENEKVVGEFKIGSGEENIVKITVTGFKGKKYLDVRKFWKPESSDVFIPTKNGTRFYITKEDIDKLYENIKKELE